MTRTGDGRRASTCRALGAKGRAKAVHDRDHDARGVPARASNRRNLRAPKEVPLPPRRPRPYPARSRHARAGGQPRP